MLASIVFNCQNWGAYSSFLLIRANTVPWYTTPNSVSTYTNRPAIRQSSYRLRSRTSLTTFRLRYDLDKLLKRVGDRDESDLPGRTTTGNPLSTTQRFEISCGFQTFCLFFRTLLRYLLFGFDSTSWLNKRDFGTAWLGLVSQAPDLPMADMQPVLLTLKEQLQLPTLEAIDLHQPRTVELQFHSSVTTQVSMVLTLIEVLCMKIGMPLRASTYRRKLW